MDTIRIVSCLSDHAAFVHRSLAGYLTARGVPSMFIEGIAREECARLFERGRAEIAIAYADALPIGTTVLAAPVLRAARYKQRPICFADVVVRRESKARSLADLRTATWALADAEPGDGCGPFRQFFRHTAIGPGGCARVVASGTFERALRRVVDGTADAMVIESAALELEHRLHAELAPLLRVVQTFGPKPMPVLAAHALVPADTRRAIGAVLLGMHEDELGRAALAQGLIARFVATAETREARPSTQRRGERAQTSIGGELR